MSEEYDFQQIEKKWQKAWEKEKAFVSCEDSEKPKYYSLEMYPYPSGRIHMGHVRNFTIVDVISRFKRMEGFNVLHPIGWDAFGMPAENAAIEKGIHPREWTMNNISHMKVQLKRLGLSYDWSREVTTCLPEYYRWNQWIFLKLLEKGLAFRKKSQVNWCPQCQTVLANEQVVSEKCWRCDTEVKQKYMEQWFLKITDYAEELLSGLKLLDKWPEHVLTMQKNWIGKSKGAQLTFQVADSSLCIEAFTTRIDTIYGATFMVLSPEHPLVEELIKNSENRENLKSWLDKTIAELQQRTESDDFEKEGIDTRRKVFNPFTGKKIPIWIANYVLMEYGTGAIMAVPAHDQRDYEFARKYSLPIKEVIVPEGSNPNDSQDLFEDYGVVVNSSSFSGLPCREAIEKMTSYARKKGFGESITLYRLRDWGISRQRYWGTPIPVMYCKNCGVVGVPFKDLPVDLPEKVEFKRGEGSPLEQVERFVKTECPQCGGEARRETDTMDTFFDSSWYYFRYCSPAENKLPFDPESVAYWLPVDIYIGGVEHAVMHLIYARFFCRILRDLGLTEIDEPFPFYLSQGMVIKNGAKMSKSKGNVVDPDDMIVKFGADSTRLFILFASPPEKEFVWDEKGIEGSFRFLNRIWAFFQENIGLLKTSPVTPDRTATAENKIEPLRIKMHQTIKKVSEDIGERYHFNTALSSVMEYFNQIKKDCPDLRSSYDGRMLLKEAMINLILLLSPFAPHICEEMWEKIGRKKLLALQPWPDFDLDLAKEETVIIVVQVNGKIRDKFEAERDFPEDKIKQKALKSRRIQKYLENREPKKVIYIKNKLINIVV